MKTQDIYVAPTVEVIKTLPESLLQTATGVPAHGRNRKGGGAKKHFGNMDLWDDDFEDQAGVNGINNNPWSNTQRRLWDD